MRTILYLCMLTVAGLTACRQTPSLETSRTIQLKFNDDGKFKIAQFTDLHFVAGSPNCAVTEATLRSVLKAEKPDVAILTGDQAIDNPSAAIWPALARIFEETQTPFAVVFGNHDAETITKDSVFLLLERSPFFIGKRGPEDIFGVGNFVLEVQSRLSNKPAALLYCFDSNDYVRNRKISHYDWIHYDQIEWYRQQSVEYTRTNNNQPLPALAFFHIPLPEYEEIAVQETIVGTKGEGIASSQINSGIFASFTDMQDVMGVFVGHDHDNDYIGITSNIALAFGRVGGADAYGALERGGRIIELYEDNPRFFSTWIRTPSGTEQGFYYPSGVTSEQENVSIYLSAQPVSPAENGVAYRYYEGRFRSVDEITSAPVVQSGTQKNLSIKNAPAEDRFAYEFRSRIKIPQKGIYTFHVFSDDGAKLYIDEQLSVNNDGSHSEEGASGTLALEEGFHDFRLLYFENHMGQTLEVSISGKYIEETLIPDEWFYLPD